MKKEIFITLCCASLMLVTPLTGVARENKISDNLSEQPDIEGLVAQMRTVVNEILQKYGHIPIVSNLCNMILNTIGLFANLIICVFSLFMILPTLMLVYFLSIFGFQYLADAIGYYFVFKFLLIADEYCDLSNLASSYIPLKNKSSSMGIVKLLQLISKCPCIQE